MDAELQDLPADGQRRLLEVDFGPAQADGLAAAQPAEGDQVQQGVEPVRLGVVEERSGL